MHLEEQLSIAPPGASRRGLYIAGGVVALVLIVTVVGLAFRGGDAHANIAPAPAPPPSVPTAPAPAALPAEPTPVAPSQPRPVKALEPTLTAVQIDSDPSGATLVLDGAIVGTTPAHFPRPESGARTLELRLDGYTRESVRVTADSPSEVRVVLRRRAAPAPAARATRAPEPRSEPEKPSNRPRSSEVVDPWAN